jgi:prevent-host-death family protein
MKMATITEVKNGLSAYIDRVKAGERVLVTDRGVPVAVIEPVSALRDPNVQLLALERQGLLRRGRGPMPRDLISTPGPALPEGSSLVDAVLADREADR